MATRALHMKTGEETANSPNAVYVKNGIVQDVHKCLGPFMMHLRKNQIPCGFVMIVIEGL